MTPPVVIHLLPASNAKVAAVIVRVRSEREWHHVMALNLGSGELTPGAWTTKRFRPRLCRLSPCGRFLMYSARDGGRPWDPEDRERPFAGEDGGGRAVSRLPWLSALTRIHSEGLYVEPIAGTHTLSSEEESILFAKFEGRDGHHNFPHQPGWQRCAVAGLPVRAVPQARKKARTAVAAQIKSARTEVALVAAWLQTRNDSPGRPVWTLVAQAPNSDEPLGLRLPVTGAWLAPQTGRLVTADAAGMLTLYQPPAVVRVDGTPAIKLKIVAQHDLSTLTPAPVRPPAKAFAPLSADERT